MVYTDEYAIYEQLEMWGYGHKTVCHGHGEYARDEDGDGFHEVHVNTMEGFWSLLFTMPGGEAKPCSAPSSHSSSLDHPDLRMSQEIIFRTRV